MQWMTLQEAEKILGISERSIRRRVDAGKLKSKKEDGRRYVLVDMDAAVTETRQVHDPDAVSRLEVELEVAKAEIRRLNDVMERKDTESAEASQRHDTIVLQLTRQLSDQQRLLEYHRERWWKRLFRRKISE